MSMYNRNKNTDESKKEVLWYDEIYETDNPESEIHPFVTFVFWFLFSMSILTIVGFSIAAIVLGLN